MPPKRPLRVARLATVAGNLRIYGVSSPASPLLELDLGALTSVGANLVLGYLRSLAALDLGALEAIGGYLLFWYLDSLVALELPALASAGT